MGAIERKLHSAPVPKPSNADKAAVGAGDIGEVSRFDYLYKEYVRLGDIVDSYGRSSFEDIKLLGAIGVLLAWPPLAKSDLFESGSSDTVLFIGLVAILFIVAILGVRDLLKQSVIRFYLQQLGHLEKEIRDSLGGETQAFRYAEAWDRWESARHRPLFLRLHVLFVVLLVPFPTLVLVVEGNPWHGGIYALVALFVLGVFLDASLEYRGQGWPDSRLMRRFRKLSGADTDQLRLEVGVRPSEDDHGLTASQDS